MFSKITDFFSQMVNHAHELFANAMLYIHNIITQPVTFVHNFVANVANEIRVLFTKKPPAPPTA